MLASKRKSIIYNSLAPGPPRPAAAVAIVVVVVVVVAVASSSQSVPVRARTGPWRGGARSRCVDWRRAVGGPGGRQCGGRRVCKTNGQFIRRYVWKGKQLGSFFSPTEGLSAVRGGGGTTVWRTSSRKRGVCRRKRYNNFDGERRYFGSYFTTCTRVVTRTCLTRRKKYLKKINKTTAVRRSRSTDINAIDRFVVEILRTYNEL